MALSKFSAYDSRQISLKILEQEMNNIFEIFPNIFDQTFGQNNWFWKIFNMWKSCQSSTIIPDLHLYCNNHQIISLNRENSHFF